MPNSRNVPVCQDCLFFDQVASLCCASCPEVGKASGGVVVSETRVMCKEFVGRDEFLVEEGLIPADDDESDGAENEGADA